MTEVNEKEILEKASIGTIPFMKTVSDWMHPNDKLVFFTLQNK